METKGRKIKDLENDPNNLLELDLSYSSGKQLKSLVRNIPKMFPKDVLETEIRIDDTLGEMTLKIRITNSDI